MVRGREHILNVDKANLERSAWSGSGKMYEHFSTNNHSSSDMRIYGIELIHGDQTTAMVRERLWMNKLQTSKTGGLNAYKT